MTFYYRSLLHRNLCNIHFPVNSSHNLACDESSATGESDTMKKGKEATGDCFILSGSKVLEGVAKVVIIAVGMFFFFFFGFRNSQHFTYKTCLLHCMNFWGKGTHSFFGKTMMVGVLANLLFLGSA